MADSRKFEPLLGANANFPPVPNQENIKVPVAGNPFAELSFSVNGDKHQVAAFDSNDTEHPIWMNLNEAYFTQTADGKEFFNLVVEDDKKNSQIISMELDPNRNRREFNKKDGPLNQLQNLLSQEFAAAEERMRKEAKSQIAYFNIGGEANNIPIYRSEDRATAINENPTLHEPPIEENEIFEIPIEEGESIEPILEDQTKLKNSRKFGAFDENGVQLKTSAGDLQGTTQGIVLDNRLFNAPDKVQKLTTFAGEDLSTLLTVSRTQENGSEELLAEFFNSADGEIRLKLSDSMLTSFRSAYPDLLKEGEFKVSKINLSKNGQIENVEIKTVDETQTLGVRFTANSMTVINNGKPGIWRSAEPLNIGVSESYVANKTGICTMDTANGFADQVYLGLLNDKRGKSEKSDEILNLELNQDPKVTLFSVPVQKADGALSYMNIKKENGKTYVYAQAKIAGKTKPKFVDVERASLVATKDETTGQLKDCAIRLSTGRGKTATIIDIPIANSSEAIALVDTLFKNGGLLHEEYEVAVKDGKESMELNPINGNTYKFFSYNADKSGQAVSLGNRGETIGMMQREVVEEKVDNTVNFTAHRPIDVQDMGTINLNEDPKPNHDSAVTDLPFPTDENDSNDGFSALNSQEEEHVVEDEPPQNPVQEERQPQETIMPQPHENQQPQQEQRQKKPEKLAKAPAKAPRAEKARNTKLMTAFLFFGALMAGLSVLLPFLQIFSIAFFAAAAGTDLQVVEKFIRWLQPKTPEKNPKLELKQRDKVAEQLKVAQGRLDKLQHVAHARNVLLNGAGIDADLWGEMTANNFAGGLTERNVTSFMNTMVQRQFGNNPDLVASDPKVREQAWKEQMQRTRDNALVQIRATSVERDIDSKISELTSKEASGQLLNNEELELLEELRKLKNGNAPSSSVFSKICAALSGSSQTDVDYVQVATQFETLEHKVETVHALVEASYEYTNNYNSEDEEMKPENLGNAIREAQYHRDQLKANLDRRDGKDTPPPAIEDYHLEDPTPAPATTEEETANNNETPRNRTQGNQGRGGR